MTPLWLAKHQALVPAAAVHFYSFTTNRNLTTLRDNQLKTELASLNRQWQTSGYRTRIIIALVADSDSAAVFPPGDGGDDEDAILDRLTVLRRAAGLDPRAIFLLTPKLNPIDDAAATTAFANALVSAMRAAAADYYRDLSKHVRRKRNRASVPPPTVPPTAGTSSPLSGHGWQARYEFKLAVFAEFRGELGAASRSYEATHALLFDTEVIDAIAGWSPRFADLRLLADAVAIRLVRALLHASCPTAAVRAWSRHRDAVRDAVARRGRGTANYGWAAWESRWAVVMAQLIDSDAQGVRLPPLAPYAPPERNGDVWPAEHLHHPGYWLRAAAAHAVRRRDLAHAIPTEDRRRPASTAAPPKYTGLYDTYLAPAPYDEYPLETESQHDPETAHSARILGLLAPAHDRFVAAGQPRAVEALRLQLGRELAAAGRWQEALDLLRLLWEGANGNGDCSWRREGWWRLFEALTAAVQECAVRVGDADVILKVSWEMMNQVFSRGPWPDDLAISLAGITRPVESASTESGPAAPPSVTLHAHAVTTPVAATFVFAAASGHVGEPARSQLVIRSCARRGTAPVRLSAVKVDFVGGVKPVRIENVDVDDVRQLAIDGHQQRHIIPLTLQEHPEYSVAAASLTLASSQTRAFDLTVIPREAGILRVASVTLELDNSDPPFSIRYVDTHPEVTAAVNGITALWWMLTPHGPRARPIAAVSPPPRAHAVSGDADNGLGTGTSIPVRSDNQNRSALNMLHTPPPGTTRATTLAVRPRPPKVRVSAPGLRRAYYTNETVRVAMLIENGEAEEVDVTLAVRLYVFDAAGYRGARLVWEGEDHQDALTGDQLAPPTEPSPSPSPAPSSPPTIQTLSLSLGVLPPRGTTTAVALLTNTVNAADYDIDAMATYHLTSDLAKTVIYTTAALDVPIIRPFEANYALRPRIAEERWPDFFSVGDNDVADGDAYEGGIGADGGPLTQLYVLNVNLASFALDPVVVERVNVARLTDGMSPGIVCELGTESVVGWGMLGDGGIDKHEDGNRDGDTNQQISRSRRQHAGKSLTSKSGELELEPETIMRPSALRESDFAVRVGRAELADRRPATVALALDVTWRRADTDEVSTETEPKTVDATHAAPAPVSVTTRLAMPRFAVPLGEPRVLASVGSLPPALKALLRSRRLPSLSSSSPLSATAPAERFVRLAFTLENPSLHYISLAITIETSDQFAFAGAKSRTVPLVPLSRAQVAYTLLVHGGGAAAAVAAASVAGTADRDEGLAVADGGGSGPAGTAGDNRGRQHGALDSTGRADWARGHGRWIRPVISVVDVHFGQTLRVLPADSRGRTRVDEQGLMVWVGDDDDDDDNDDDNDGDDVDDDGGEKGEGEESESEEEKGD